MSPGTEFEDAYRESADYFGHDPDRLLIDHADRIRPAGAVLDIGIGQGRNAFYLAEHGFIVHGIDTSHEAVQAVRERAARKQLNVEVFSCGFELFEPIEESYDAILMFGLIQTLPRQALGVLRDRANHWLAGGGLLFITAWTTDDPSYGMVQSDWRRLGRHSFQAEDGRVRTYLEPGEVLTLFPDLGVLHHSEEIGPWHRHGDGEPERHARVEAVLVG